MAVRYAVLAGILAGLLGMHSTMATAQTPAVPVTAPADSAPIDAEIRRQMAKGHLVGVAAAVILDGEVVWRGGYGLADRESVRPFTTDTVMNIASISKTVVGAAMMRAQDEGQLSLDADVSGYLPFVVRNPHHPEQPITLRQLATHTSSITDRWPVYAASYHFGRNALQSLGEFLQGYLVAGGADYAPENFLSAAPGADRDYSNIGAGLAGYIVERVTGEPLARYAQRRLFEPLGMHSTRWHLTPAGATPDATLYIAQDEMAIAIQPYTVTTWPDGGVRTSVEDLSKFFIALLNRGQGNENRVLQQNSVDEMLRLQFTATHKPGNVDIAEKNSGLFWQTKYNTRYVGHGGSDPGMKTEMLATPDLHTGVVFFTNTSGEGTEKAYDGILKALFAHAEMLRRAQAQ
ncbi:beta-lactamase family protein [Luteimonas sp. S4-F44]|uniref:serine hydrolase domain-containing protein n=1 Tax=Luteimonas sp. S4-F44 TaxID=2925842 RepID=UPI001F530288|nr:serine hydrolase domain-containing protein [Luteimonas sp. S4-F44]UNK41044.1 beta-lactamase family protein [Luteimonas sp. S4-F44]